MLVDFIGLITLAQFIKHTVGYSMTVYSCAMAVLNCWLAYIGSMLAQHKQRRPRHSQRWLT